MIPGNAGSQNVYFKLESLNPTGSYKDRASSVLTTFLRSRAVFAAVEESSGNAGASFAAYCSPCLLRFPCQVFIPEGAPLQDPKGNTIET